MPDSPTDARQTGRDTPGAQALRAGRVSLPGQAYLLTTCAHDQAPILMEGMHPRIIIGSLFWLRDQGRVRLHAFVVMATHIHFVMTLEAGHSLPRVLQTFKGFTARQINAARGADAPVWQEGYRDDRINDYEDMRCRVQYVHENPVRPGLVRAPDEYMFSGAYRDYRYKLDGW